MHETRGLHRIVTRVRGNRDHDFPAHGWIEIDDNTRLLHFPPRLINL